MKERIKTFFNPNFKEGELSSMIMAYSVALIISMLCGIGTMIYCQATSILSFSSMPISYVIIGIMLSAFLLITGLTFAPRMAYWAVFKEKGDRAGKEALCFAGLIECIILLMLNIFADKGMIASLFIFLGAAFVLFDGINLITYRLTRKKA